MDGGGVPCAAKEVVVLSPKRFEEIASGFAGKRVLVIGDLYLDEYLWGDMDEISKEGPIPVIHVKTHTYCPGAAANAANGVRALGGEVFLAGVAGDDANGHILLDALRREGINIEGILIGAQASTNTYSKISAGGFHSPKQEVLRIDTQRPPPISESTALRLRDYVVGLLPQLEGIAFVDQASSVVTDRLLEDVSELALKHGVLLVGDSRERVGRFRGFNLICPNDYEASAAAGADSVDEAALVEAGRKLLRERAHKNLIITRGKHGMMAFEGDGRVTNLPTFAQEVFDVTGAGDTVTAATCLSLLGGASLVEAAEIANLAAGVAVSKSGTVTVSLKELRAAYSRISGRLPPQKIRSLEELRAIVDELRAQQKRIAWTNGCFDIVHSGHIAFLREAKRHADVLIVGINGDRSAAVLKGPVRPVLPQAERAQVIAELATVDYVTIFEEATCVQALKELRPDVYLKGRGYSLEAVNQEERQVVESYGGRIVLLAGGPDVSTSEIIQRIASVGRKK